mgnify:CR=1 FL=1
MKLPIEHIHYLPLKTPKYGNSNRDEIDIILDNIIKLMEFDEKQFLTFLENAYSREVRNKTIKVFKSIKVPEEERKNFLVTEDEIKYDLLINEHKKD